MAEPMFYCRTCDSLLPGGVPESHDHAIDAHREVYLADPGALVFEVVVW